MTIKIGDEHIPYRVERSPGRKVDLRFAANDPVLLIRTPEGKITPGVQDFVRKNSTWIIRNYQLQKHQAGMRDNFMEKVRNGSIPWLGDTVPFQFVIHDKRFIRRESNGEITIFVHESDPRDAYIPLLFQGAKALAKDFLIKKTYALAEQTGSIVNSVRVKGQKSKWGSCSGLKNINLNWHLIFLRENLIDYVIIHELMHLREMNHSQRFWFWVSKYFPDYKSAEEEIKQMGWLIGIADA